jgi:hypothetical protein
LVANIPSDADAMMVYDQEPHQQIVAWLLERAGLRQAVVDAAFEALGQDRQVPEIPERETLRNWLADNWTPSFRPMPTRRPTRAISWPPCAAIRRTCRCC